MESSIKSLFWRQNSIQRIPDRGDQGVKGTGIESDGSSAAGSSNRTGNSTSVRSSISSAPSERPVIAPKIALPTQPLDPSIFKTWHESGEVGAKPVDREPSKPWRGPSYHDLIHPAVKKGSRPSKLKRTPSDYYNENIAERNSKFTPSPTGHISTSDLTQTRRILSTRPPDSQRATIEKMRASQENRSARTPTTVKQQSDAKPKATSDGFRLIIRPPSSESTTTNEAIFPTAERLRIRSSLSLRGERAQWVEPRPRPASRLSSTLENGPRLVLDFDTPTYQLQDPKPKDRLSRRASTILARVAHPDSEDDSEIVVRWDAREDDTMKRTRLDLTEASKLKSKPASADNKLRKNPQDATEQKADNGVTYTEQSQPPAIQDPIRVDSAQPSPVEDSVFNERRGSFAGIQSQEYVDRLQSALARARPASGSVRQPQHPVSTPLTVDVLLANSVYAQQPVTIRSCTATILQPTARPPQAPPRIASRGFAHPQSRRVRNAASIPIPPSARNTGPPRQRRLKPQPTTASIDEIIATKKEAAARALVRLHEVMAIPIPEEPELETDLLVRPSSSVSQRMARAEQVKVLIPVSSLPMLRRDGALPLIPLEYRRADGGQQTRRRSKRRRFGVEIGGNPRADSPTLPTMITT